MSDEKQNEEENLMEVSNTSDNSVIKPSTIENILKSIEEIAPDFFSHLKTEKGKDRELENKKNKRGFIITLSVISAFVIMWFTAMMMGQFEMAMTIINILLAIGAGAGVMSAFK